MRTSWIVAVAGAGIAIAVGINFMADNQSVRQGRSDVAVDQATAAAREAKALRPRRHPHQHRVTVLPIGARPERPDIVKRYIPFTKARKRQMAHYSQIHYGDRSWHLSPKGIVLHYTATNSLGSVFSTFESNQPDPELGQLPGTCAHFVIGKSGTIYQLVPLDIRCRHTVGMNDSTIGIEHVGTSDRAVMGNRHQRNASLALTLWLMSKYRLSVGDVIGHSESLTSPLHHELFNGWRCQTHGDFQHPTGVAYRKLLRERAVRYGLKTSRPVRVDSGC